MPPSYAFKDSSWENSEILISNLTSRWERPIPAEIHQMGDTEWSIMVPRDSFSEGHNALIRILKGDAKLELTGKVTAVARHEKEEQILFRLTQYSHDHLTDWRKALVERQSAIDDFIVSARGFS